MKTSNNLNQLLSRMKTLFGHKASAAANVATIEEPPTDHSDKSDPRIRAVFADIEKYLAEYYGTPIDKFFYQDYANGASFF